MIATVALVSSISACQRRGSSSSAVSNIHGSDRSANVRMSGPSFSPLRPNAATEVAFRPRFTKLRTDSGRQTLVDNDFEHELRGSEIRIDGFKPANSVVDLSRF